MTVLHSLGPALGPLALGLAALSHPSVAGLLSGGTDGRAVGLARLIDLAAHHMALAGSGLAIVGLVGTGLGVLAARAFGAGLREGIDAAATVAQGLPPVVIVAPALPVLGFGGPPTLFALVAYGVM